jgi:hypothetical protein
MEPDQTAISAPRALFIKLGSGGDWEADCIARGELRLGYHEVSHAACVAGEWTQVEEGLRTTTRDAGALTRHLNQVREFYEAGEDVLWITFFSDRLWWCRAHRGVSQHPNGDKTRAVIGAWSDQDLAGAPLLKGRLSGKLLALQMYRGTICSVGDLSYLLHKINATAEPHVAQAQTAFEQLQHALHPIIRALHPSDLEILVDLVFRQAGWQRVGVSGGTEKDIDLDLISLVTGERIAVQVKAETRVSEWNAYRQKYADMRGFSRFYFVTPSARAELLEAVRQSDDASYVFWGIDQIAAQAVRGGLTGWLLDKAS